MGTRKTLIVCLVGALCCANVFGAVPPPHQKLMARRAAELDGYRNMTERVLGLKISSDSMVRDFIGQSDQITASLDQFIKGLRIDEDKTAWYDDGSCEVVVEVTLARVITELATSCDRYYKGGRWTMTSFQQIKTYTQEEVLTAVGAAAVRTDSVVAEPQTVPIVLDMLNPREKHIDLPEIYTKYPAQKRLMARRIAHVDAYRKLAERIYGLQINATTKVVDFDNNLSSDWIRGRLDNYLKGGKVTDVRYQPDGIVEVQVCLTLEQVITTLKKVCDEYFTETGKRIKSDQFEEITKQAKRRTVVVLGMGAITGEGTGTETTSGTQGQDPTTGTRKTTTTEVIEEGAEVIKID